MLTFHCVECQESIGENEVFFYHLKDQSKPVCEICAIGMVTWVEDAPAWLRYWFPLVRFIVEYPAGHSVNEMEEFQNVAARTYPEERSMFFYHGLSWHVRSIYPTPLFLHEYAHLIVPEHHHDEIYREVERWLWEDWGYRKTAEGYYEVLPLEAE